MSRRIIGPVTSLAVAAICTKLNPAIWPLTMAVAALASINLYNALTSTMKR